MRFSIFLLILALTCSFSSFSNAKEFRIDLSDMELFKKKGFGKKTIYSNGKDEKGYYLKAVADDSATGIGMELDKNIIKEMNWLHFSLKIEQDFVNVDKNFQKTKEGHDFTAKIILGHAKKLGSKLVSLAHSSFLEEGYIQRSPHNKGSRDFIASNDSSGDWHTRKINVKKLLEETHGISWSNVIIFFTDSNNTGQKVITYYRDVYFSD